MNKLFIVFLFLIIMCTNRLDVRLDKIEMRGK